ncbi:MAG: FAD binding domain-containing protein [Carbonactinosporaceae bacterium]
MKPAPFAYLRAGGIDEAVAAVAEDGEARVLAGGQSLVPMLAMRLARPTTLVDINGVPGLAGLLRRDGELCVGTLVRQRDLECSREAASVPLLAAALPHIGHRELRNRGTVGGSIAHADPAGELPAVAVTLDATVVARGPQGERRIRAREFFTGPLQTALAEGELLTAALFPTARSGDGFAFEEVARRRGDFALCGVAVAVHVEVVDGGVDGGGVGGSVESATVGVFGVAPAPVTFDVSALVGGAPPGRGRLREAGEQVASWLTPGSDVHASAGYRRRLAAVLVSRCLAGALADARAPAREEDRG